MTGHTTLQFVIDFEHTMLGMYYAHIYNYAYELYPLCQTIPIMPNFFLIHQTSLLTCGAKHSSTSAEVGSNVTIFSLNLSTAGDTE